MIFIEAGARNTRCFDAQLAFAEQLNARGHNACIEASYLPEDADRGRTYDAVRFLVDREDVSAIAYVVLGAEDLGDPLLISLREKQLGADVLVTALGRFEDHQSYVGTKARLAYALGREVHVIDLSDFQPRPILSKAINPLVAELRPVHRPATSMPRLTLVLGSMELDNSEALSTLARLNSQNEYRMKIVVSGAQNNEIKSSPFSDLPTFQYTDLSPLTLASETDILAVFGHGVAGERIAALSVALLAAGGIVLDCTEDDAILTSNAPVLLGPKTLFALEGYLTGKILKNLTHIGEQVSKSSWLHTIDISLLEHRIGLNPDTSVAAKSPPKTLFMPTNGVGLGHAQRCAVVANKLPADANSVFAAFPSCVPLVRRQGFDCIPLVARTDAKANPYSNDIVNYGRLRRTLRQGDRLVFDGGFVFDSVYRVIVELKLPAVWIRRGLWPGGRPNPGVLDREDVFDRVIVPMEAFDELNDAYSFGDRVRYVGPIYREVTQTELEREKLRAHLARLFGLNFQKLVVSMLGGGVASVRTAQFQAISGCLSERPDCLHLIVTWPGSTVHASLFNWPNTRLVNTLEATALSMAADLTISAAGYNSVHEILYYGLPAILIPQSAPYLDDQMRRAKALSDRGLSAMVAETEMMRLERLLGDCLDHDAADEFRAALEGVDLPEAGAEDAARLIADCRRVAV